MTDEIDVEELSAEARQAARNAYAPYSDFRVGAVAVTKDGTHFAGANVENAAYPSGICAEANAIVSAVAAGHRELRVVAVACVDASNIEEAYPCGQCLQRMFEFGVEKVVVTTDAGDVLVHDLDELLPHGFRLRH